MNDPIYQLVNSVEKITFLVVLLELFFLVVGAIAFRALLRVNLTLKPQLVVLISQLKQAKINAKAINQQLNANQAVLESGLLSLGKALPKPLRWLSKLLGFIV